MERKKSKSEIIRRYSLFFAGVMLISFGIALLIKSSLGVSPISSVPYTLSLIVSHLSVGEWTILAGIVQIILQIVMRPRDIHKAEIALQLVITFVFGYFIDFYLYLMSGFTPEAYIVRMATLLLGCVILSFGAYIQLIGNVGMLPMDALLQVTAEVTGKKYSGLRIFSDTVQAAASAIACIYFLGELSGVREGTIIAALICGNVIKLFQNNLTGLSNYLMPENVLEEAAAAIEKPVVSENHFVLTISHEYGSGGRTIAKRIAHELDLPYFDTEIINMAAKKSGYAEAFIQENEERIHTKAFRNLSDWYGVAFYESVPEKIFKAEAQVIQEIAAQDSCVIVGRLANYILQNHKNSLHIFITADETERVRRVMRKEGISQQAAEQEIRDFANERRNHCQQFSDMEWGNGLNYDITIKSNKYGVDRTAAILIDMIRTFRQTMKPF